MADQHQQSEQQYAFRAQKSLGLVNGSGEYSAVSASAFPLAFSSPPSADGAPTSGVTARMYTYSDDGRYIAFAMANEVHIYQSCPTKLVHTLQLPNVIELHFSPKGTYLATWERPRSTAASGASNATTGSAAQHKNLSIHHTLTGSCLVAFTQKSLGDGTPKGWDLQYTADESLAVRLIAGGEIQVFRPDLWSGGSGERLDGTEGAAQEGAANNVGLVDKVRIEGASSLSLSPSLTNPSIAAFVPEKKGMPASVSLYSLSLAATGSGKVLSATPTVHKSMFKADRATLKWNPLGTHLLLQTTTDVDNSNKSYYGESLLYLIAAGPSSGTGSPTIEKVTLDKQGPVHDFTWSPSSLEFGVVYGFMPARTSLFSSRLKLLHDFPPAPYNFISYNPYSRLLALAGFGNLAGKVDIWDRRTLKKVSVIRAEGSSVCKWSSDGCRLLTATLSPRLRVDNGVRIWWVGPGTAPTPGAAAATPTPATSGDTPGEGSLIHVQETDELYQASWRPFPSPFASLAPNQQPSFPSVLPPPPAPSPAALAYLLTRPSAKSGVNSAPGTPGTPGGAKPLLGSGGGAYRPPGARGLATPAIFKREDEGGLPSSTSASNPNSGPSTPTGGPNNSRVVPGSIAYSQCGGGQQQNGHHYQGHGHHHQHQGVGGLARGGRYVPGAPSPPGGGAQNQNGQQQQGQGGAQGEDAKKRKRSKGGKKGGAAGEGGEEGAPPVSNGANANNNTNTSPEKPPKKEKQPRQPKEKRPPKDSASSPQGGDTQATVTPPPQDITVPPSLEVETDLAPVTPGLESAGGGLDAVGKKIRNLNKKLKAIEELKEKAKRGERLETTQLKKMEGEAEIRKELAALSPVGA